MAERVKLSDVDTTDQSLCGRCGNSLDQHGELGERDGKRYHAACLGKVDELKSFWRTGVAVPVLDKVQAYAKGRNGGYYPDYFELWTVEGRGKETAIHIDVMAAKPNSGVGPAYAEVTLSDAKRLAAGLGEIIRRAEGAGGGAEGPEPVTVLVEMHNGIINTVFSTEPVRLLVLDNDMEQSDHEYHEPAAGADVFKLVCNDGKDHVHYEETEYCVTEYQAGAWPDMPEQGDTDKAVIAEILATAGEPGREAPGQP